MEPIDLIYFSFTFLLISGTGTFSLDLKFCQDFKLEKLEKLENPAKIEIDTTTSNSSNSNSTSTTTSTDSPSPSPITITQITIPDHLLTTSSETISINEQKLDRSKLSCKSFETVTLSLIPTPSDVFAELQDFNPNSSANYTRTPKPPKPKSKPPKSLEYAARLRGKTGSLFTSEGHFVHDDLTYEKKEDNYCISRISDSEIQVRFCPIKCGEEGTLCIPKCCGVGEVALYWSWGCIKVPQGVEWTPTVYESSGQKLSKEASSALKIRYSRPHMPCTWDKWPQSYVRRPKQNITGDHKIIFKILKTGEVVYLHFTRRWRPIPEGKFCIDGFANWGYGGDGVYTGLDTHQVMLTCRSENDTEPPKQWKEDLYASLMYTLSIFILLTVIIHFALFDKQNIHGFTILSQSISIFCYYVSYGTVYLVSQRRDSARTLPCILLAIFCHFSFLTTFSWLTVANFDLWLTFRSMRPVSRVSKKMRRFRLYSLIGWGIPFILISIFVFLDLYYRDIESEVVVPDYGAQDSSCFVASWARWHYICSILGIVIPINLIMIIWTFKIFHNFKKGTSSVMPKSAKSDRYSFKIFTKLFLVMGTIWSFDAILCWFYNNGYQSPWFINIIDCMILTFQAVAIFAIFCWNKRTLRNLEEKYPRFKVAFAPIKRLLKIKDGRFDTWTDTSPSTPGGTLRKMSGNSVISMEGTLTLDRRRMS